MRKDAALYKERKARLKYLLTRLNITRIKTLYRLFYPEGDTVRRREELSAIVLKTLCFENQDAFDQWFSMLTEPERVIIRRLTFYKALPANLLKKETKIPILIEEKEQYRTIIKLNPDICLKSLIILSIHDVLVVEMPEILQVAFKPFLPSPKHHDPNGSPPDGETIVFHNANKISGIFELLYETLASRNIVAGPSVNPFRFTKKAIQALYQESAFPRFPECDFPLPDSLCLATVFILCEDKPEDNPQLSLTGGERIRDMVRRFFRPAAPDVDGYYYYGGSYFEGLLLSSYLKRRAYPNFEITKEQPQLRQLFLIFLSEIAKNAENAKPSGQDVPVALDTAFSRILDQGVFLFSEVSMSSFFRIKASSLTVDGVTYRSKENGLIPESTLVFELITKPLFRAYCFVFATLGCLELTVAEPPFNAKLDGKGIPVSLYDGLCAVRLTEFGKWCLGFTEKKPEEGPQDFEISADPSLLYVTFRGESIERQIYLDKIGTKIGAERWTVNAASFLNGCTEKVEILERIKKFRALIDEHPAEHWEAFFARITKNAGILDEKTGDFLVYHFSPDKETRAALLGDTEFRRVARFAEDNLILVPKSDRQKFFAILADRGINIFATPHRQDGSPY